jgi:hypothetical protein
MKRKNRIEEPLAELSQSQLEEVKKYRWIESEKAGRDIGWERALTEWMQQHFPAWKRHSWKQAVDEAVSRN